ncbi:MAG TPA: hypothetical protein VGW12_19200 [Pyrinomonadaceae bacterium]|nr:hypothetical protein [Pyrinomonadaceae bacterium]
MAHPKIIFLDEPLAGLDAAGVDEVMGLLGRLNRERGFTLVIIEHASNIHHLMGFATGSLTLSDGKLTHAEVEESRLRGDERLAARLSNTLFQTRQCRRPQPHIGHSKAIPATETTRPFCECEATPTARVGAAERPDEVIKATVLFISPAEGARVIQPVYRATASLNASTASPPLKGENLPASK